MFNFGIKKKSPEPTNKNGDHPVVKKNLFATKKRIIIFLGIMILIAVAIFIFVSNQQKNKPTGTALPTFSVVQTDITESLSLSGTVATAYLTQITTKAEGVITEVYVQNGDYVEEGEELFELELTPTSKEAMQSAYNSYVSAKNGVASAEAALYSSQSTLFNKNQYFINHAIEEDLATNDPTYIQQQADWLAAEANYKNQEAQIKASRLQANAAYLNYQNYSSTITAPVSGEVAGMAITEGMMVTNTDDAAMSLGNIKNGETYVVSVSVSEMDIAKIAVGQSASITITAVGDEQVFTGSVISIDTVGSYTSSGGATYPVLINFTLGADDSYTILPNMSADAEIIISQKSQVVALSTLAIQSDSQGYFVDLLKADGTTEKRTVELGLQTDNYTEIITGLNVGDQVQMGDFSIVSEEEDSMIMMGGMGTSMGGGMGGGMGGPPTR